MPIITPLAGSTRRAIAAATMLALSCLTHSAHAHEYYAAGFKIIHPWSIHTESNQTSAPVYMHFEGITESDRLISASTPIADKVDIVGSPSGGDTPTQPGIALPAGQDLELKPGQQHLLLTGLKVQLLESRSYPLTLVFEKSGTVETMLSVGGH